MPSCDAAEAHSHIRRFFSSLRFRLMLLVVLTLMPAFGLAIHSTNEQRRLAAIQAQENALRTARAAAGGLEQFIRAEHQFLSTLAQLPAVRDHDPSACSASLERVLRGDPWFMGMMVADRSGSVVCGAGLPNYALDFSKHQAFRQAFDSQQFSVSDYRVGPLSGKGIVTFGQPIVDQAGQVQAVLLCSYDVHVLSEVAAQSPLPAGSALVAIDRKGTIMARYPNPDVWLGRSVAELPIMEAIRAAQGEGAIETVGEDGLTRLYAFTPVRGVPDRDMFVSVGIPTSIAFAEANERLRWNLIGLALVAVLALTIAWVGGNALYARRLGALLRATGRLTAGDLSARTGLSGGVDELGQLANAFDKMTEALAERELERAEEARARAQLLQEVISAQEDERKRIARELHDETSQGLSVLIVSLETVGIEAARAGCETSRAAQTARTVAQGLLDGIRRLIADLRPSLLDDLGLAPAIAWYAEERIESLGIAVDLQCDLPSGSRLPPALETALFRIAQEAIGNIAKHAGASHVTISLRVVGGTVVLSIEDDGCGFEPGRHSIRPAVGSGFGLQSMSERASALGGELRLRTAPGQGTRVEVEVPFLPEEIGNAQNAGAAG